MSTSPPDRQLRTLGNPNRPYAPGPEDDGSHGLRSLNVPRQIRVVGQRPDGAPAAIIEGKSARRVTAVLDEWWVEDEWWRDPISRHYLQVQLADGHLRTIYHDTERDTWHTQNY